MTKLQYQGVWEVIPYEELPLKFQGEFTDMDESQFILNKDYDEAYCLGDFMRSHEPQFDGVLAETAFSSTLIKLYELEANAKVWRALS